MSQVGLVVGAGVGVIHGDAGSILTVHEHHAVQAQLTLGVNAVEVGSLQNQISQLLVGGVVLAIGQVGILGLIVALGGIVHADGIQNEGILLILVMVEGGHVGHQDGHVVGAVLQALHLHDGNLPDTAIGILVHIPAVNGIALLVNDEAAVLGRKYTVVVAVVVVDDLAEDLLTGLGVPDVDLDQLGVGGSQGDQVEARTRKGKGGGGGGEVAVLVGAAGACDRVDGHLMSHTVAVPGIVLVHGIVAVDILGDGDAILRLNVGSLLAEGSPDTRSLGALGQGSVGEADEIVLVVDDGSGDDGELTVVVAVGGLHGVVGHVGSGHGQHMLFLVQLVADLAVLQGEDTVLALHLVAEGLVQALGEEDIVVALRVSADGGQSALAVECGVLGGSDDHGAAVVDDDGVVDALDLELDLVAQIHVHLVSTLGNADHGLGGDFLPLIVDFDFRGVKIHTAIQTLGALQRDIQLIGALGKNHIVEGIAAVTVAFQLNLTLLQLTGDTAESQQSALLVAHTNHEIILLHVGRNQHPEGEVAEIGVVIMDSVQIIGVIGNDRVGEDPQILQDVVLVQNDLTGGSVFNRSGSHIHEVIVDSED